MTFRGIREAEEALFGGPTYSMSVRQYPPGGEDRIDDMAQAWIDGRHDEVLAFVARHKAEVRARTGIVKPKRDRSNRRRGRGVRSWARGHRVIDHQKVIELRERGIPARDIARICGCTVGHVHLITRKRRYVPYEQIAEMIQHGVSGVEIAERLHVSLRTVGRAAKKFSLTMT